VTLKEFFRSTLGSRCGDLVLVAFSGGPDSTALLAGLAGVAPGLSLQLHAAHLDHGLDPDSGRRALGARRLAGAIGVPLTLERLSSRGDRGDERAADDCAAHERCGRDGPEAWARRRRYAFLERLADELGARFIATAHHADDQAETVLLRLLFGSGIEGLAAIRPRRGRLVRPLLGLRRSQLLASLAGSHLEPVTDPTNAELVTPRNHVRHRLLPSLASGDPRIVDRLCRLAAAARRAGGRIDRLLGAHLNPGSPDPMRGVAIDRAAFDALPAVLLPHALAFLHRLVGAPYPAAASARGELERQIGEQKRRGGGRIGCDCGGGWRWESDSAWFRLVRCKSSAVDFTYTWRGTGRDG